MKFNIYIKILTAFFVIFLVLILLFFNYLKYVESTIIINAGQTMSQGLLISIEEELVKTPESEWNAIIKKKTNNSVHLIAINNLNLPSSQKNQLNQGEIIFLSGSTYQFLNEVIVEHTAYKKIGSSPYALAYCFSDPSEFIFNYMHPTLKHIVDHLLSQPENRWEQEALKLEKIYSFPLHVYKIKNKDLPNTIINSLSTEPLVFETNKNSSQIVILYYAFGDGVLKIGPLSYLPVMARISDVMNYFILAFFTVCLFLIAALSLLFVKNIKKIYQITKNFSQGNFDFPQKIGAASVLYELYINIIHMGARLKELIESHKQMCRFVAHEIRTPLSTMQMATESIKRKNVEDASLNQQVNSIQEDITDINRMVSTFLIYSKMHSSELKLNLSETDIVLWLKKLLVPYSSSEFEITVDADGLNSSKAYIDESILKHAVTNLITNAMKFAEHHIALTISRDDSHILIHVDDDGPGLSAEAEDIFSEYAVGENDEIGDTHMGLGLAIVKKVVTLHEGKVMATQSPLLRGARFTMMLPRRL